MTADTGQGRCFLFLQGPHGPFFWRLARHLRRTGARCVRVGFNLGDRAFWPERHSYLGFRGGPDEWQGAFSETIESCGATDLVLYGDTRPVHAEAIVLAKSSGLRVHVFEEGYLRPWWVTYERDGSNGHSPLMGYSISDMNARLESARPEPVEAPAHWGDMREHIFYGALYHACVLAGRARYRNLPPHRNISVRREFALYLRKLAFMPAHWATRLVSTTCIRRGGYPYHLVLLQLDHDASLRHHGRFASTAAFLAHVIGGFARSAPAHHHLVMKSHPLEDGRVPQRRLIARLAREAGVGDRVHYVRGGKLARLLDAARSAITVNSTAAQQALWRGLPTRAFGTAVYSRPELTSFQSIDAFFEDPEPPDRAAYEIFRQFLLETSQIAGGYYSGRGRRQLYRQLVDIMLADTDRYARKTALSGAAPRQHLKLVGGS